MTGVNWFLKNRRKINFGHLFFVFEIFFSFNKIRKEKPETNIMEEYHIGEKSSFGLAFMNWNLEKTISKLPRVNYSTVFYNFLVISWIKNFLTYNFRHLINIDKKDIWKKKNQSQTKNFSNLLYFPWDWLSKFSRIKVLLTNQFMCIKYSKSTIDLT